MKNKLREEPEPKQRIPHIPADNSNPATVNNPNKTKENQTAANPPIQETIQQELEKLRKLAAERDQFLDLAQRTQADFLNYQKRVKREQEEEEKYRNESILQQLLTAFDNLDRVLKIPCSSPETQCLMNGIDLTKKELLRILEKNGVTVIKTTGEKFDPARHEAIMVTNDPKQADNTVSEECSPGYLLHNRVLRPAQVKVNKHKPVETAEKPDTTQTK
jgi:molecular chaperone GrpE